jgi:hypothetical protein
MSQSRQTRFDGTAAGNPGSRTASDTLWVNRFPTATTTGTLPDDGEGKLQGSSPRHNFGVLGDLLMEDRTISGQFPQKPTHSPITAGPVMLDPSQMDQVTVRR